MSKMILSQPQESLPDVTTGPKLVDVIANAVGTAVSEALEKHASKQEPVAAVKDEVKDELRRGMLELQNGFKEQLQTVHGALDEQKRLLERLWQRAQGTLGQDLPTLGSEAEHNEVDAPASTKPAQVGRGDGKAQSAQAGPMVDSQASPLFTLLPPPISRTSDDNSTVKRTQQECTQTEKQSAEASEQALFLTLQHEAPELMREMKETWASANSERAVHMENDSVKEVSFLPPEKVMIAVEKVSTAVKNASRDRHLAETALKTISEEGGPNMQFTDPDRKGYIFTPLTKAIELNDEHLVRLLLRENADPDSKYWMPADEPGAFYKSPGAVYAVKHNNSNMLKLLLKHRANLQGHVCDFVRDSKDESGPTLLWRACEFGKIHAVKFLLDECPGDLEEKVYDCRANNSFTPLHQAVVGGHSDIVELLLEKHARIQQQDLQEKGSRIGSSINIAVEYGKADVCRILVKNSANIFAGNKGERGIDCMLGRGDVPVMAAVADALSSSSKEVEKIVRQMTLRELEMFTKTPGCEAIFDAIFRPKQLRDKPGSFFISLNRCRMADSMIKINAAEGLDEPDLKKRLQEATKMLKKECGSDAKPTSKIADTMITIDVAEGLDEKYLKERLKEARKRLQKSSGSDEKPTTIWTPELQKFRDKLLPGSQDDDLHKQVHVEIRQCIIADVHKHPQILWELVDGPNADEALKEKLGAQALVLYYWEGQIREYTMDLLIHFVQAILFLIFSLLIGKDVPAIWRYILGSVSSLLWLRHMYAEVTHVIGVWNLEHRDLWSVQKLENALEWFRILLISFGNVMIFGADEFKVDEVMEIRIILGILTFVLWSRVLYAQRGLDYATNLLPIITAISSSWPFFLVMFWPCVGVVNCYYLLNAYSGVFRVSTIVFRMALLGDFDLEELEDVDPTFHPSPEEDGVLEEHDPVLTKYHFAFALFMGAFALLFAMIMMNLLVGVLSDGYNTALKNRQANCLKARASIVVAQLARREGRKTVRRCFFCDTGSRAVSDSVEKYLWFCCPAEGSQVKADSNERSFLKSLKDDVGQLKSNLRIDVDADSYELDILQGLKDDVANLKESLRKDAK